MRWLKSWLSSSALVFLGVAEFTASVLGDQTEIIRQLTLNAMGKYGENHHPKSVERVRHAQGPLGLWYARTDLMAVLSAMHRNS